MVAERLVARSGEIRQKPMSDFQDMLVGRAIAH
ncbi:hypothetical protein A2U01_0065518 [Trifolium medium]|uniref:Uncharacterized protein n=1 Tax=Trifolium medium TaxID=97028 RepID=A0A392S6F1_9FABA|nr:hypothetical protein [Trifolium medium]